MHNVSAYQDQVYKGLKNLLCPDILCIGSAEAKGEVEEAEGREPKKEDVFTLGCLVGYSSTRIFVN